MHCKATCDREGGHSIAAESAAREGSLLSPHRVCRRVHYAAEANSAEAVKWLREAVATGFRVYPLFERDALLVGSGGARVGEFMTELKATVDGYRREFTGR